MAQVQHSHSEASHSRKVWGTIRQRTAQLCAARRTGLTPLREAVLAELWRADKPLGAYDLAARISESGESRIAPNTIYRILDLFLEIGIVRRVESKHAYHLVDPAGDQGDILLMCDDCGGVTAIGTGQVRSAVAAQSEAAGFHPTRQVIEVAGLCHDCDNARGQHD